MVRLLYGVLPRSLKFIRLEEVRPLLLMWPSKVIHVIFGSWWGFLEDMPLQQCLKHQMTRKIMFLTGIAGKCMKSVIHTM